MPKTPRVGNSILLNAGLELMRRNGKPLTKIPSSGRSMLYAMSNGDTVRVRTCNDHILIMLAESPSEGARLNIEGTDRLLIVMPEVERTPGKVIAYLVPTAVAAEAARLTHREWLLTNPNTNGTNTTWNLWFDKNGHSKANDFAAKWRSYRLDGEETAAVTNSVAGSELSDIRTEVEAARQRISRAAGVPPAAVRITVDFGG